MKRTDCSSLEELFADNFRSGIKPFISDIFKKFDPNPDFDISIFYLNKDPKIKNITVSSSCFDSSHFQGIENDFKSILDNLEVERTEYIKRLNEGKGVSAPFTFVMELFNSQKYVRFLRAILRRCKKENLSSEQIIVEMPQPIIAADYVVFVILSIKRTWIGHYVGESQTKDNIDSSSFFWQVILEISEFLTKTKWNSNSDELDNLRYSSDSTELRLHNLNKLSIEHILARAAGRLLGRYMYPSYPNQGLAFSNFEELGDKIFYNIKVIAAQKYETKECAAEMRLIYNHAIVEIQKQLSEPVELNEHRAIRKLLESTGKSTQLVLCGDRVLGITSNDSMLENDFIIKFKKFMTWELCQWRNEAARRIFLYEEGEINPRDISFLAEQTLKQARKCLDIHENSWFDSDFQELIQEIQSLGHGGILVFTDQASISCG